MFIYGVRWPCLNESGKKRRQKTRFKGKKNSTLNLTRRRKRQSAVTAADDDNDDNVNGRANEMLFGRKCNDNDVWFGVANLNYLFIFVRMFEGWVVETSSNKRLVISGPKTNRLWISAIFREKTEFREIDGNRFVFVVVSILFLAKLTIKRRPS